MKIRAFYNLDNGVYRVSLYTQDWSEGDQQLMSKFGEPEIDVGGIFTGPPALDLDPNLVKVSTDSPFSRAFDIRDSVDAENEAGVWAAEIISRITSAVTVLRGQSDNYSKEEVTTV